MWSGPGPPSPLLHSCHVCVPPERKTGKKRRAEVFFIEFWLRKNAKCPNTRGHKFLTGRKRKFQWNQISDSPAECFVNVCVLVFLRFLELPTFECEMHSFIHIHWLCFVANLHQTADQYTDSESESYLTAYEPFSIAAKFQGEKYFTNHH